MKKTCFKTIRLNFHLKSLSFLIVEKREFLIFLRAKKRRTRKGFSATQKMEITNCYYKY